MKTLYSTDSISPFGGIHFVYDTLSTYNLNGLMNQQLGRRTANSTYTFSDLLYGMMSVFMCGGDCAEDIQEHVGPYLNSHHLQVSSPDTLLRMQKKLAAPTTHYRSYNGVDHEFSWNGPLARLNVSVLKRLGSLRANKDYILDYDNVILTTCKDDARRSYRHDYGYQPGVAMIGDKIVYVENRNGNSEPMFRQYRTLRRTFKLLGDQSIHINCFRADSGSYTGSVVHFVADKCDSFFIKARLTKAVMRQIANITDWQKTKGPGQYGCIDYKPFSRSRNLRSNQTPQTYRLVVRREAREDGQINLFTEGAYQYQAILTSDTEKSDQDVFAFYRKRGAREREFDILKNDFGWKHLPFSKINQNTVYLLLTALIRNIYGFIIRSLARKLPYLHRKFRLKKFIFRFITVPAKWIRSARQDWLKLYTKKLYPD